MQRNKTLDWLVLIGLVALVLYIWRGCSSITDDIETEEASFFGKGKWEYYDIAPPAQNQLWRDIGSLSEKRTEAWFESNDVRKDEYDRQIMSLGGKYEITNFVGKVVDVDDDYIKVHANNLHFKLYFRDTQEVWDLNWGDVIRFNMTKKSFGAYETFLASAVGGAMASVGLTISGNLKNYEVIEKH